MRVTWKRCLAILIMAPFLFWGLLLSGCQSEERLKSEWLTVAIIDSQGRSSIWLVDPQTGKKKVLLNNREVMLSGKLSSDGNWLAYTDAIGDGPWDAFLLNIKNNMVYQVTHDRQLQFNLRFANNDNQVIYAKVGGVTSWVPKIAKIDINKKEAKIVVNGNQDLAVEAFDIAKGKIIAVTYSFNEDIKRHQEANEKGLKEPSPMMYHFIVTNLDGTAVKEVAQIKARNVDSVSWGPRGDTVVFGGSGVDSKNENGIYQLGVKEGKISMLLSETEVNNSSQTIKLFLFKRFAVLSADDRNIYFNAVPIGSKEGIFDNNILSYPSAVYSYDREKKNIKKVFQESNSFVTDLNITYH